MTLLQKCPLHWIYRLFTGLLYSNSTWTFIALNLPYSKGTLRHNKTKAVNQFQYPGTEKKTKHYFGCIVIYEN